MITEQLIKIIQKELVKKMAGEPGTGDIIVVYDGNAPEAAAKNIAAYLNLNIAKGKHICLMDADKYIKMEMKLQANQVIIVGHHDLTKKEIKRVTSQYSEYGMEYGKSVLRYVLKASKSRIGKKDAFANYYDTKMSQSPYRELAEAYGTPVRFEDQYSTREAQYGLLWIEFVLREFSQKAMRIDERTDPDEAEPPPAHPALHSYPDRRPEEERFHEQRKIADLKAQGRLNYGIVFCGGGAKGAFELGVWKWLAEHRLAEHFTGVSGASVGALNTLLFAQEDYKKAESVWLSMNDGDLVQTNEKLEQSLKDVFQKSGGVAAKLAGFLRGWQENAGAFDKKKLSNIVRENISVKALEDKLAYVSLTVFSPDPEEPLYPEYSYLDNLSQNSEEETIRKVLASAALPGAYVPETINGRLCIDGGVLDNCPVYPLVKAGFREILVVHLSPRLKKGEDKLEEFNRSLNEKFIPTELEYIRFHHIWPVESLGNLLKINPELTKQRIQAGYEAACNQLGRLSIE